MRLIDADKLKESCYALKADADGAKVKKLFDWVIDKQKTSTITNDIHASIISLLAETTDQLKYCKLTAEKEKNSARYKALMDALEAIESVIEKHRKGETHE